MLVQIEDLKRANKRWKITAGCAFFIIAIVSVVNLERYAAEQVAMNRALEEAELQEELAERQRAKALQVREMVEATRPQVEGLMMEMRTKAQQLEQEAERRKTALEKR